MSSMHFNKTYARSQFMRKDWEFVEWTLGLKDTATSKDIPQTYEKFVELVTHAPERDQLLDQPQLSNALQELPTTLDISLYFYFYVLLRHVMLEVGYGNRDLADYLSNLMVQCTLTESFAPRSEETQYHQPIIYMVDFLKKMENAEPSQQFYLSVDMANHALLLTGIFPEFLQYRTTVKSAPPLSYYVTIGSTQYQMASKHKLAAKYDMQEVLGLLGDQFEDARLVLNTFQERFAFFNRLKGL